MAMSPSNAGALMSSFYENFKDTATESNTFNEVLDFLSSTLDAEFQNGIPSLSNVDITTPAGSFSLGSRTTSDSGNMIEIIADEVVRYWSDTVGTSGSPVSCSSIASVSNTASSIKQPIMDGLLANANNELSTPNYQAFFGTIIDAVKTIVWTVSESGGDCSETYSVTVT